MGGEGSFIDMNTTIAIFSGVALAAACGFRVFVPLLAMSLASRFELIHFSEGFAWVGSDAAMLAFAIASALEIAAYYLPWIDNLLDSIATPLSVVAGAIVMASFVADMDPLFKWTMILIAGGGLAGFVQSSTVTARAISTGTTGGLANPLIATAEVGGSAILSVIALLLPIAGLILVVFLLLYAFFKLTRKNLAR